MRPSNYWLHSLIHPSNLEWFNPQFAASNGFVYVYFCYCFVFLDHWMSDCIECQPRSLCLRHGRDWLGKLSKWSLYWNCDLVPIGGACTHWHLEALRLGTSFCQTYKWIRFVCPGCYDVTPLWDSNQLPVHLTLWIPDCFMQWLSIAAVITVLLHPRPARFCMNCW